jgi:CxxC-x17-CxxC domain-containing protein
MSLQNKSICCSDCGSNFGFSAEEKELFRSRGYTNEPKRCPTCRQARKSEQYKNGSYIFGRQRHMSRVTCNDCGKETEVPFKPRAGSPVYCPNCYYKVSGMVDRCMMAIATASAC